MLSGPPHTRPASPRISAVVENLRRLRTPLNFDARPATHLALPYRASAPRGTPPLADVWLPAGPGPHPSLVLVHGGGFVLGSRGMKPMVLVATRLSEAGIAVASVDYRLAFRGGDLNRMIDDVSTALAWWRGAASEFHLDPERIALGGASAGAALAWLAAETAPTPPSHLVSIYGVYDLRYLARGPAGMLAHVVFGTREPQSLLRQSPLTRATAPAPALLLHGTADRMVPIQQAEALMRLREERGLPSHLHRLDGAPHGFLNDANHPASPATVDAILEFMS